MKESLTIGIEVSLCSCFCGGAIPLNITVPNAFGIDGKDSGVSLAVFFPPDVSNKCPFLNHYYDKDGLLSGATCNIFDDDESAEKPKSDLLLSDYEWCKGPEGELSFIKLDNYAIFVRANSCVKAIGQNLEEAKA